MAQPAHEVSENAVMPLRKSSVDDVIALAEFIDELFDLRRVRLKIVIHTEDIITACVFHSGENCIMLTAVFG